MANYGNIHASWVSACMYVVNEMEIVCIVVSRGYFCKSMSPTFVVNEFES